MTEALVIKCNQLKREIVLLSSKLDKSKSDQKQYIDQMQVIESEHQQCSSCIISYNPISTLNILIIITDGGKDTMRSLNSMISH